MKEFRKKFVALDLETTHLDSREGKIMEVGACEFEMYWDTSLLMQPDYPLPQSLPTRGREGGLAVKFGKTFSSLVNPEIEPSEISLMITGIKSGELKAAPLWSQVKPELEKFIGQHSILGHNLEFDLGYLSNQGLKLKNDTLDTLELARTLLPLETSHSLESLAEGFAVLKEVPHRALADCQNAARLAAEIVNKFLGYPQKLQKEVKRILGKSEASFIHMVKDLPELELPLAHLVLRGENFPHPCPLPQGAREQRDVDIEFVDKTLYCYPLSFNGIQDVLASLARRRQQAVIGVSHKTFLADLALPTLINPALALCEERFALLLAEESLSPEMAKILAKTAILRVMEDSLDLGRLKWAPEEMQFLHYLTVNPRLCLKHHCSYVRELDKPSPKPVFADLETVFALAREWHFPLIHRSGGPPSPASGRGLQGGFAILLFELSAMEDRFTDSCRETWNLKKLRNLFAPLYRIDNGQPSLVNEMPAEVDAVLNELDLFFGILHLMYLKREGEFAENLVIDEAERNRERFGKLFHPAQKLKTKLEEFTRYLEREKKIAPRNWRFEIDALALAIHEAKNFLECFFIAPQEYNISWVRFNASALDLNLLPRDLMAQWKNFSQNFSAVTIVDTILPQVPKLYFQKRLGLMDYLQKPCFVDRQAAAVQVKIFSKNLTTAEQIKFFENLEGETLLLMPSEPVMTKMYQALRAAPRAGAEILAYKFSGNVGTLKKKLQAFTGKKLLWLLTTHALLKHWRILPPLSNLVIFKLPFEARGSKPALLGLPESGAFMDIILPRAISILHRISSSFLSSAGGPKKIFILDPRILTDYDQSFMKYFEEFPDFMISTV